MYFYGAGEKWSRLAPNSPACKPACLGVVINRMSKNHSGQRQQQLPPNTQTDHYGPKPLHLGSPAFTPDMSPRKCSPQGPETQ